MKKTLLIVFGVTLNCSIFADDNASPVSLAPAQEKPSRRFPPVPPRPEKPLFAEDDPVLQVFSPKALALLEEYAPRPSMMMTAVPEFYYPLHDNEKHYNEEYISAWMELYNDIIFEGSYTKKLGLNKNVFLTVFPVINSSNPSARSINLKGITSALSEIASTNSIPMLTDVYTRLLGENQDENQARQRDIFGILLHIDSAGALDAVFTLLDLTENKVGAENAATLRDSIEHDFRQALKKRKNFNAYKNPNLSVNNQALLERARQIETETPATQQINEELQSNQGSQSNQGKAIRVNSQNRK